MRIRVGVAERRYGFVDLDVPEDSKILNPESSTLTKRRAAKELAESYIQENSGVIVWPNEARVIAVDLGYFTI